MILFKEIYSLRAYLKNTSNEYKKIGFIPTMGALHKGHLSLIEASKKNNDITVCSIFVNPTQFNNADDFAKYPITIEGDINLLEAANCDILFLPIITEMYPINDVKKIYELGFIETVLEGSYRPGHFNGVCIIVDKLLTAVAPQNLYLGRKDYQQCMVIQAMMLQQHPTIQLNICATVREADGLAMSSRNMRLTEAQRTQALKIIESLIYIKNNITIGDVSHLKKDATFFLQNNGYKVDYTEIADAATLQTVTSWDGKQPIVALVAAYLDTIRLIDNIIL